MQVETEQPFCVKAGCRARSDPASLRHAPTHAAQVLEVQTLPGYTGVASLINVNADPASPAVFWRFPPYSAPSTAISGVAASVGRTAADSAAALYFAMSKVGVLGPATSAFCCWWYLAGCAREAAASTSSGSWGNLQRRAATKQQAMPAPPSFDCRSTPPAVSACIWAAWPPPRPSAAQSPAMTC